MIRTLALVFCFAWFVRSGTLISTAVTAGNEVLLQFITVAAFVLDGFAFVAEKEAGEAYGARDGKRLARAMRLTTEFALISGARRNAGLSSVVRRCPPARHRCVAAGRAFPWHDPRPRPAECGSHLSCALSRRRHAAASGLGQYRCLGSFSDNVCVSCGCAWRLCAAPVQRSFPTASASVVKPSACNRRTSSRLICSARPGPS